MLLVLFNLSGMLTSRHARPYSALRDIFRTPHAVYRGRERNWQRELAGSLLHPAEECQDQCCHEMKKGSAGFNLFFVKFTNEFERCR